MNIAKKEQHDNEWEVFNSRSEGGLQAMRMWLLARQERINTEWVGLSGDDLIRMQGEARAVAKAIKLIEVGPTIKQGVT